LKVKTSAPYCPPENISADSIRNQLQRILASPEFTATESQHKFLKFVVLETLSGNSDEIKGFTVAIRKFVRVDASSHDSIVQCRIEISTAYENEQAGPTI